MNQEFDPEPNDIIFFRQLHFFRILSNSETTYINLNNLLKNVFNNDFNLIYISFYLNKIILKNNLNENILIDLFNLLNDKYLNEKKFDSQNRMIESIKIYKNLFNLNLTLLKKIYDKKSVFISSFSDDSLIIKYLFNYIVILLGSEWYWYNDKKSIKSEIAEFNEILIKTIEILFEKTIKFAFVPASNIVPPQDKILKSTKILQNFYGKINLIFHILTRNNDLTKYIDIKPWYKLSINITTIFLIILMRKLYHLMIKQTI